MLLLHEILIRICSYLYYRLKLHIFDESTTHSAIPLEINESCMSLKLMFSIYWNY